MFPYEQLAVYKKACQVNQKIYRLLKENKIIAPYIKNQLGRACLSIMLNIAEGSAKYSAKDRRNFFITAKGSVFECTSIICFLNGEGDIQVELKNCLYPSFEEISQILYAMIKNLEGSRETESERERERGKNRKRKRKSAGKTLSLSPSLSIIYQQRADLFFINFKK